MRTSKKNVSVRLWAVLAFAWVFIVASAAASQEPLFGTTKTMDPRTLGVAGASIATPSSVSGLYMNPATLAMANYYHLGLMYQYTGQENLHMGGIAIVDSVTSSTVAAGLAINYLGAHKHGHTDHDSWDGRLALGANFGDVFFMGMTGRYLRVEHDLDSGNEGPSGPSALPSSGSQQVDGFTFDAGAALRLGGIVGIGLTGYNLTNTGSAYAPLQLGTGISLALGGMAIIESDLILDFTSHDAVNQEVHSGVEVLLGGSFPLRVGHIIDVYYRLNTITAGLGYVDKAFALDLGFGYEVRENARWHLAFGVRIFIG